MAINDPYVPGDPYSYDLKWMVRKLKAMRQAVDAIPETVDAAVQSAIAEHSVPEVLTDLVDWSNSTVAASDVFAYRVGNDIYFRILDMQIDPTHNYIQFGSAYANNFYSVDFTPLMTRSAVSTPLDTLVAYYVPSGYGIAFTDPGTPAYRCSYAGHITLI